jgi:hypothetical protein
MTVYDERHIIMETQIFVRFVLKMGSRVNTEMCSSDKLEGDLRVATSHGTSKYFKFNSNETVLVL